MTRGVTVALQILVLPVKVRILAGQQMNKKPGPEDPGFFISQRSKLAWKSWGMKKAETAKRSGFRSQDGTIEDHGTEWNNPEAAGI